jgi:formylglycine-generating enzyme
VNIGDQATFARQSNADYFIPTEDEWYKAAYHKNDGATGNYFDYPTSSDTVPSNDLTNPDDGNNATFRVGDDDDTIGSPYWRTEKGDHENSESPYGTFDQGGNVWEWNETVIDTSARGLRGGNYFNDSERLHTSYRPTSGTPSGEHHGIGFRVASIPEPGSISLLVCGLVAGMLWWRRRK